jgi:hypothetical protein
MVVANGCGDEGAPAQSAERPSVDISELTAGSVVSGVGGYSWIVGSADNVGLGLYRFRGRQAQRVADLSRLDQGVQAIAFGELVVVGGVRCADDQCDSSVLELLAVDADGRVLDWGVLDTKMGPPDDTDTAFFLGESASRLWTSNLAGELLAVDAEGAVVAGPIPPAQWTDPCVIGPDLYRVEAENPPPPPPPGVPEQVPFHALGFRVSRWDGSRFVAVPGSLLPEAESPGPLAFCADLGFEVPSPTANARWEPGQRWQRIDLAAAPPNARSGLTQSRSHRWYVVDASGALRRRAGAGWVEVGPQFTSPRGDEPPFALTVDDAHDQIVACLATDVDLECRVTPT